LARCFVSAVHGTTNICLGMDRIWFSFNQVRDGDRGNWVKKETNTFPIIKPTKCVGFSNFILGIKFYIFRRFPLSIIRTFSLYTQQWYMSYRFADSKLSANLYDTYHFCVYSEKLLIVDRGTLRNV
jgi:hypothetical protein